MTQQHDAVPPPTAWTVTGHPHRAKPERIALAAGAASNLLALVTLAAILLGGPVWVVVASIIATALTAVVASHGIRAIPRQPLPRNRIGLQQEYCRVGDRSVTSTGSEFG